MTEPMTATEALRDALATALLQEANGMPFATALNMADAILAALPPGTVLTTVDDVARRLCKAACSGAEDWTAHRAEAGRLLGVGERDPDPERAWHAEHDLDIG